MSMDTLKATFFAECEELVEAMTEGLSQIASDDWDTETVNAIFRAVHSIKGAAGAFGFEKLVEFAHKFETVLDRIRNNELAIDADVLRIITRASDILAELVELAQVDPNETPTAYDPVLSELANHTDTGEAAAAPEDLFAPVAFAPLALVIEESADEFTVKFSPTAAFYRNGHEPERIFAALGNNLGVTCEPSQIPALDALDPDQSYLSWSLDVRDMTKSQIEQVFEYAEGLASIEIMEKDEPERVEPPNPVEKALAVPTPKASGPRPASTQTLRIDPERVDRLINTVGELIINQAVIAQKIAAGDKHPDTEVASALDDYRYLAREIQEAVMSIRAQPVKSLFQRMARVVREAGVNGGAILGHGSDGIVLSRAA
ncbi:Hpt domain-containing protein [Donghicola sp. XS_ASV15]|uniref:Hpt domain-containing protein n=1 Tax=Donghicola sp. XS_ASV15 TaxID=3241295 RepID=UPI0035128109